MARGSNRSQPNLLSWPRQKLERSAPRVWPKMETKDGVTTYRLQDGQLHRKDGPAVIIAEGCWMEMNFGPNQDYKIYGPAEMWFSMGRPHRGPEEGEVFPAAVGRGWKHYYYQGKLTRLGDHSAPALVHGSDVQDLLP